MRWLLTRGLFVGTIALIGIIYTSCTEAKRSNDGEITSAGTVKVSAFQVGDCFLRVESQEFADAKGVPCSEPHAFEVFAEEKIPIEMTPDSTQFLNFTDNFCIDNAYTYVGSNFDFINISFDIIVPTKESFLNGDRTFQCIFLSTDDSNLVGSLKDKGR
jgi:hypothetical protein